MIKFISTIAFSLNYFVSQNCYYIKLINGFVFDGYYEIKNSGLKCQLVSKHESFLKNIKKKNDTNLHSLNGYNKDSIVKTTNSDRKKKQKVIMKWYFTFLPVNLSMRSNKTILGKYEIVKKTLNVFELMRTIEMHKTLKKQYEDLLNRRVSSTCIGMNKMAYDTSTKKNITMNMLSAEKKTNSVSVKCNAKSTYNYCNNDSNVNIVNSSIQD